jgi:hypothetical protein
VLNTTQLVVENRRFCGNRYLAQGKTSNCRQLLVACARMVASRRFWTPDLDHPHLMDAI